MSDEHTPMTEHVILLEDAGTPTERLRLIALHQPRVGTIYERERGPLGQIRRERIWHHLGGEQTLTGERIFRELPAVAMPEVAEHPQFDELHVKIALYDRTFVEADRARKRAIAAGHVEPPTTPS